MIGKLKGSLIEIEGNLGLVETSGGVSYQSYLTPSFIKDHPVGSDVSFYTYLQVRDDALVLFGFETKDESRLFKLLLTVSGVGPKTAFAVISATNSNDLFTAIRTNDTAYFSRIPGLGKKTAMKIILELSQKLKQEFKFEKMYLSDEDKIVVDALVSLGFKSNDAQQILSKIDRELSVEDKIKAVLKIATNHKKKV